MRQIYKLLFSILIIVGVLSIHSIDAAAVRKDYGDFT